MFRKLVLAVFTLLVNSKAVHSFLGTAGRCNSQNKSLAPMSMSTWALGFPNVEKEMNNMMKIWDEIPLSMLPYKLAEEKSRQLYPLIDFKETKDEYEYIVDAPGVKKENVKVEVRENMLKIEMQRQEEKKTDDEKFHRTERFSGYMRRIVQLPDNAKDDNISANYENGVLHVHVPKVPGELPVENVKQIEVK